MRIKQVGGGGNDHALVNVKNADTVSIPVGTPVCMALNGTDDGLAVVLPATALAATANSTFLGISIATMAVGARTEAFSFGLCPYAILTASTRAATSDSFSTNSWATGNLLCIDTLNNALKLASASLGSNNFMPFAIMAQSLTVSGSATATNLTLTVNTVAVRVFIRLL